MTYDEMLGLRIKDLRENAGMSQEDLARKVGYSTRGSISYIEQGKRSLSASQAVKFARALGVTIEDLISGEPEQTLKDEICDLLDSMDHDQQQAVLSFLVAMLAHRP